MRNTPGTETTYDSAIVAERARAIVGLALHLGSGRSEDLEDILGGIRAHVAVIAAARGIALNPEETPAGPASRSPNLRCLLGAST